MEQLLLEYAYENKKFREKYDELEKLITDLDDRISQNSKMINENTAEIDASEKDANIEVKLL